MNKIKIQKHILTTLFFHGVFVVVVVALILFAGDEVFAQSKEITTKGFRADGTLKNPLSSNTLIGFLKDVLRAIQIIVTPIVVFFLILGGFKFVTAQGNSEKLKEARQSFLWVIVGALIILGATVLVEVIANTVNQLRS